MRARSGPCYPGGVDREIEALRLARVYVWWHEPGVTLADPRKLLCQILRLGRPEDFVTAQDLWGEEALRRALAEAGRGEIDAKSRHFWELRFGVVKPAQTTSA